MLSIEACKEGLRRRQERLLVERERLRQSTMVVVGSKLREIGRRHAGSVRRLYIFGSLVSPGRFGPGSDIDVAVDWREKGDYFGMWREIEEVLDCEVDFRELGNDPFSQRVRHGGLVVYESGNR